MVMAKMKRSLSESDTDDVFDDPLKPGSPSQSCQITDRKKRRGIIEKRRRDRINSSLSELRRLVPAAFEKQGSAKLEKAEILQMTVDHLKVLHQKGLNGYNYDQAALAMDYRSVGFRECAAEVARYLVTVEGMDIQDPLRLRLLSHLQCFSAQREAAAKASLQSNSWTPMATHHGLNSLNSQYNTNSMPSVPMLTQHGQSDQLSSMTSHSSLTSVSCAEPCRISQHHVPEQPHGTGLNNMRLIPCTASAAPQVASVTSSSAQISPPCLPGLQQIHTQFPVSLSVNSVPMLSPSGTHYSSPTALSQSMKPYRPWGTELAY